MCGIVGYVGKERCVQVLMEGLRQLEYRGYDSAGLALQGPGGIEPVKRVGPLKKLAGAIGHRDEDFFRVRAGVGHTRWATHGSPSEENAHPHLGGAGTVAVVHNGIIENHAEIREELEREGYVFNSETDTEVMAHLLARGVEVCETLREALAATLERLEGSFAVAAISAAEPEIIVAARNQSPLVIGLGDGENYLASAVQALVGETREFLVVENGEIAEITASSVLISKADGTPVEREPLLVDWDPEEAELGLFEDFMNKEIHEQPEALRATLADRLAPDGSVNLPELTLDLSDIDRVVVVACGTAYHAGLLAKHAIERLARVPVEVAVASEYRYADPIAYEKTLLVAISQSGETTDTLAAIETGRASGAKVVAVTNTRGSLITREADAVLLTKTGPEIAVASTKTFLAQVLVLDLLALELGRAKGVSSEEKLLEVGHELRVAPEKISETLEMLEGRVEAAAELFEEARCSLFLGRGPAYPAALEGALKLKEISYIPSEGYPAGEMKHGPIALVDDLCPVVALLGEGILREKTLSNVQETVARGAKAIAVAHEDDAAARKVSRILLPVPKAPEILAPLVATVPLQLLSYHVARSRGLDVDKPRNLAKSVTVE